MLGIICRILSRKGHSLLSNSAALNTSIFKRTKINLSGKSVIIAGGINGLAYETARALLCKNVANLGLIGLRKHPKLEGLAKKFPNTRIVYCKTDVADEDQIKKNVDLIVKKFKGCLDIFINNTTHVLEQDHVLSVKINLLGTIYGTLCALDHMDKCRGGKGGLIVNISSIFGLEPFAPMATYSASKHAVVSWTRSMASQCYEHKTCVNHTAICPCLTVGEKEHMKEAVTYPGCEKQVKMVYAIPVPKNSSHASGIVKAIEEDKNGSIWMLDGKAKEVEPIHYWSIPREKMTDFYEILVKYREKRNVDHSSKKC